ncbi:MAG: hypothetical protein HQL20_09095 [Candidatus Omnitrophica bacterium]|nr:hypothetical protein [Candidatus Omnitrophota bacterium]
MGRKLLLGLVALVFTATTASAASIGRVKTLGQGKFAVDQFNDVVLDREMKAKTQSESGTLSGSYNLLNSNGVAVATITNLSATYGISSTDQPDLDKVYISGAGFTYGLLDKLDIYARLGVSGGDLKGGSGTATFTGTATNVKVNGVNYGPVTVSQRLDATWKEELKQGLAYALGLKYTEPFSNGLIAGMDLLFLGQENKFKNTIDYTLSGDIVGSGSYSENGKGRMYEWQAAPYIAKEMGAFTPYAGVKYSQVSLRSNVDGEKTKFSSENNAGVFLGTDINWGKSVIINFEGRFIDETALSARATFKF